MSAGEGFKGSRLTIRVKLLLLTATILIAALGAATVAASVVFRTFLERQIQEYNLSIARLIGFRLDRQLRDIALQGALLHRVAEDPNEAARFFAAAPGYALAARAQYKDGALQFEASASNPQFLNRYNLSEADLQQLLNDHAAQLGRALQEGIAVENLSPGFVAPALAVALPHNSSLALVVLDSGELLKAFQEAEQSQLFDVLVVNDRGELLAISREASEGQLPIATELPIVQTLLNAESDNRSLRYRYRDVEYLGAYQLAPFARLGVVSTVAADQAFEAALAIELWNLRIFFLILTVALVAIYFFARTLSEPIRRLVRATQEVEAGRYETELQPGSGDEIGLLTASFARMARGLAEKERIASAFGKFVNPAIVQRALQGQVELGGEMQNAVILFADLRDFTALSERLHPQEVVALLNQYFTAMVDVIHHEGGVVDKFIGDAIMAHWGAINSTGADAEAAVRAALGMRRALLELNHRLVAEKGPRINFGIGINAGPVLAGQIGSTRRLEYTVIGDAVNLASRIEYLNKHFGTDILVSEEAWRQLGPNFRSLAMPAMRIKGKSNPETAYAILGQKDDPDAPRSLTDLRQLIGLEYDVQRARKQIEASSDTLLDEGALVDATERH